MAVSNLVTTGGLTTSDLVTNSNWTLLGSTSFAAANTTYTISGLNSFSYRKLKIVFAGQTGASTGVINLRINNDSTTYVYQYNGLGLYRTAASPYFDQVPHNYIGSEYSLTIYEAMQYGSITHASNAQFMGQIEISNANNTEDKHIKALMNYKANTTYAATLSSEGLYKPSTGAVISSVTLFNTNTTMSNGSWGYGMKVYGAN